MANGDDFERNVRLAIRRHWVLFLIPGVVMVILGLLAAASPFIATLVVETLAGWLILTGGFVGLAALFTTRNVPGFVWALISALLAILIGAFLVRQPFVGLESLTIALAIFFAVHGVVQILKSLAHRQLFADADRRRKHLISLVPVGFPRSRLFTRMACTLSQSVSLTMALCSPG